MAMNALKKTLGKDFDINRLSAAFVSADDQKYKKLDLSTIRKLLK